MNECERRERQRHVAAIVEHHRRHERARILVQEPGEGPREQPGPGDDADGTENQDVVCREIEILIRQRSENERWRQDVHVDAVDPRHVRLDAAGVEVAQNDDAEHGQDDAEYAFDHGLASTFSFPLKGRGLQQRDRGSPSQNVLR